MIDRAAHRLAPLLSCFRPIDVIRVSLSMVSHDLSKVRKEDPIDIGLGSIPVKIPRSS